MVRARVCLQLDLVLYSEKIKRSYQCSKVTQTHARVEIGSMEVVTIDTCHATEELHRSRLLLAVVSTISLKAISGPRSRGHFYEVSKQKQTTKSIYYHRLWS